ncbi:MAG TPA: alcohol dehydrogenase catalytic domain-containing protein [Candidatus Dormibacteraeota bacterium]|nr:alcohol dehydrogenase catalytic domain-containing protein [Candidatus Dormibacteraeota bacterium]
MLACLLEETRKITVKEVQAPKLSSGDVLVKMEACGVCGTDLEKIDGKLGPGGILGHEPSGTIQEITDRSNDYKPGDRVVAHHHVPCYNCSSCLMGDPTICERFKKTNLDPCGLATSFRVPRYNVERGALIRLPKELTFEEGAMIEPTACCIRAIRKAHVRKEDNVLVVGLGPTGLTQTQILRNLTSRKIIGTDIIDSRLKLGARLGADETVNARVENVPETVMNLTRDGADLAVVATGNVQALDQAFASVRKGGRVLLFGAPSVGARYQLDVSGLFSNQISLISSYSCVESEMHEAMQLVSSRGIDVRSLISDKFALKEAAKALDYARTSTTAIKTIITS